MWKDIDENIDFDFVKRRKNCLIKDNWLISFTYYPLSVSLYAYERYMHNHEEKYNRHHDILYFGLSISIFFDVLWHTMLRWHKFEICMPLFLLL